MTLETYSSKIDTVAKGGEKKMKYTIKELRARKKETQADVAKAIGVSTTTYNAWEKDLSNVAISKVAALSEHFGVSLSEIAFF